MKKEIKKALSAVYCRLSRSYDDRAQVQITGGHIIEGGKAYKRSGRVAWKAVYRAIRFDGQVMQWEEGMDYALPCILRFLGQVA